MNKLVRSYKSDRVTIFDWILFVIAAAGIIACFRYIDVDSYTVWSLNIWDTLFSGKIGQFYSYTAQNLNGVFHDYCACLILPILAFAVPLFPLWAVKEIFDFNVVNSYPSMLYAKLVLAGVFCLVLILAVKICKKMEMTKTDRIWMCFLSGSSIYVLAALGLFGQTDVFMLLPLMLGINATMDNKKKTALLWYSLAVTVKPFALFVFLPILLLREKKLLRIIMAFIPSVILYAVFYIPFLGDAAFKKSLAYGETSALIGGMVKNGIPLSMGTAAVFFIFYIALAVLIYMTKPRDSEEEKKYIVYYAVLSLAVYFLFSDFQAYRIILLSPLLYILIMSDRKKLRINILLDTAATSAFSVWLLFRHSQQMVPGKTKNFFASLISDKLPGVSEKLSSTLSSKVGDNGQTAEFYLLGVLAAVFAVCIIVLLVINHPKFNKKGKLKLPDECSQLDRPIIWLRTLALPAAFIILQILLYNCH